MVFAAFFQLLCNRVERPYRSYQCDQTNLSIGKYTPDELTNIRNWQNPETATWANSDDFRILCKIHTYICISWARPEIQNAKFLGKHTQRSNSIPRRTDKRWESVEFFNSRESRSWPVVVGSECVERSAQFGFVGDRERSADETRGIWIVARNKNNNMLKPYT